MNSYRFYSEAEDALVRSIVMKPDYITDTTFEKIGTGFILTRPDLNVNLHSNYEYAEEFFQWMQSGQKELSEKLVELNPWVKRFVDSANLPNNFSATYGWKIREQNNAIMTELITHRETRRAYVNINYPGDKIILPVKSTHEFPCTIGFQLMIREAQLHMIVNMRSNNVYAVMPYDVYNFTELQQYYAKELKLELGKYYHQINNAHIYKGDVRRIREQLFLKS